MISATTQQAAYPDPNIDPRQKDEKWILQYAKAAWGGWSTSMPVGSIFYAKAARYLEIREYAMGRQSVGKYQKNLLADDQSDETLMKISWEPRADGMVIRNIAVAKVQKAGVNIICTPINANAKDAQDKEFKKAKVKILMRQAMEKQNPELAQMPQLKKMTGEADDLEELQMQVDFNPKFIRAKDVEESVGLVFYENDFAQILDSESEDIVDFGVGIVAVDINENNKVILRKVNLDNFICSYTRKPNFNDIIHAGEIVSVKLSDLAKKFTEEQIKDLEGKVAGKNGNPSSLGFNTIEDNGRDIYKVDVLDLKFITWNKRVTEENIDKNGNLRVSKAKPSASNKPVFDEDGNKIERSSVYTAKSVEVVYKCKWVVGTDLLYDFGVAENQPRTVNIATMGKTSLGYVIRAASFDRMKASGLTENMISIIDDLCETQYKIRNFRNRMIANGFDIDLDAIENVALGASGQKMKPQELIDNFFESGVLVSRRGGGAGENNTSNYKAINAIQNNMSEQLIALANDLQMSKQALRDISGLNELTDGSTPNPKTLTTIANLANESTNNSLYYLINCRKSLIEGVAREVVQRLQIAVKKGPYDGYNPSAGKYISVPKSIADYDYDLMVEDMPTEEQKQIVYNLMLEDIKNGFISHADAISIIYTYNLKQMAILLSHKVEKGKQKQQDNALANTKATADAQMQSNAMAEEIKNKYAQEEHLRKMAEVDLKGAWAYLTAMASAKVADGIAQNKAHADILKTGLQEETKRQTAVQPEATPVV